MHKDLLRTAEIKWYKLSSTKEPIYYEANETEISGSLTYQGPF